MHGITTEIFLSLSFSDASVISSSALLSKHFYILSTEIIEVDLSAIVYRLFDEDFLSMTCLAIIWLHD